ncbi:MAG: DNA mismatch repair endonuclease MutL [Oscillospiraceae bacterium]|nr:DNA mismatch repair endonuclease MutL [Oscillospiraceae bacterium]
MPIQVLPKHVADLIAAGEVVERPASVVKELCENALDAGATSVTVEIRSGGVEYIRVTDNGGGISRDDMRTAFLTHATSKVSTADDLDGILTLGFRGEALPSIAAVARVQVLSRRASDELGQCYVIEAGEEVSLDDAGCPQGTTIIVRDLFFNTPARAKFLKTDMGEGNLVGAVVEKLALARPEVAITFIRQGKQSFATPGDGNPASAVRAVLGKPFAESLLEARDSNGGIEITGFVCRPSAVRANRSQQYFFLNGRWVKNGTLSAGLEQAYRGSIMTGRYPACVLYITMSPQLVDVNVHPAKTEVRFAHEKAMFSAVYQAAKAALGSSQCAIHNAQLDLSQPSVSPVGPVALDRPCFDENHERAQRSDLPTAGADANPPAPPIHPPPISYTPLPEIKIEPRVARPSPLQVDAEEAPTLLTKPSISSVLNYEFRIASCVEVFGTYFLAQVGDELLLIDKHAAHERMLYEQLKAQAGEMKRQVLLSPLPLNLGRDEVAALLAHGELLMQAGFLIEPFGEDAAVLRECPMLLCGHDLHAQVSEMAGYLLAARQDLTTEALDWIFHSAACRAAVKANDPTTQVEREHFVQQLLAMPNIRHCPHGRPVMVTMTRREVEKMFGRV